MPYSFFFLSLSTSSGFFFRWIFFQLFFGSYLSLYLEFNKQRMFTLRTILQLFLSGQRKNSRKFESLLWISNFPSCEYKMYIAVKNGDWSAVKIAEGEVKSWDRGLNIQMNFLEERFAQDRPRRKGRRIVELSRRWLPHLSERLLGTVFRNFEFPDSLLFSLTMQLTLSLSLSLSLLREWKQLIRSAKFDLSLEAYGT